MADEHDTPDGQDRPASDIIAAFGGIRPMAHRLGVPVSTVQGWKQRDSIPEARLEEIRAAAAAGGIALPGPDVPYTGAPDSQPDDRVPEARVPEERAEGDQASDDQGADKRDPSMNENADTNAPEAAGDRATGNPVTQGPATAGRAAGRAAPSGTAGRAAMGLAALALAVALAIGGWLWWTTEGPGAVGATAPEAADPGREAREALARAVDELRAEMRAGDGTPPATAPAPDVSQALAPLRERLDALAAELEALREAAPPAGDGEDADTGDGHALVGMVAELGEEQAKAADERARLTRTVESLERRLGELSARLEAVDRAQAGREGLDERVAALEADQDGREAAQSEAIALSLAASQLRRAIDGGEPYDEALAAARAVTDESAGVGGPLGVLAAYAGTGVATRQDLRIAFPAMARAALEEADVAAAESWGERLLRRAGDIVSIRRVGPDVEGDGAEARLARAEYHLEGGDLSGAIEEIDALGGAAGAAASEWLERARARRDVEHALDAIERVALDQLRAGSPGADTGDGDGDGAGTGGAGGR